MGAEVCGYGSQVNTYGSRGLWIWDALSAVVGKFVHRPSNCTTKAQLHCTCACWDSVFHSQVMLYGSGLRWWFMGSG